MSPACKLALQSGLPPPPYVDIGSEGLTPRGMGDIFANEKYYTFTARIRMLVLYILISPLLTIIVTKRTNSSRVVIMIVLLIFILLNGSYNREPENKSISYAAGIATVQLFKGAFHIFSCMFVVKNRN